MRDAVDIVVTNDFFPKIGGAHLWLYEVYRRWPRPVHVITALEQDGYIAAEAVEEISRSMTVHRDDVRPTTIGILNAAYWRSVLRLHARIRAIAGSAPVRLHCLRAYPEGFASYLYKLRSRKGVELATYAHGEELLIAQSSRLLHWMMGKTYEASDVVIANSRNTKRLVTESVPETRVAVINPGVESSYFHSQSGCRDDVRQEYGWSSESVLIVTVARMELRKNHSAVVRAVATLRSKGIDVIYACIGTGDERENLGELTSTLGLTDSVCFLGEVPDVEKARILAAADIFAMPSIVAGGLVEGFGIVFLEAAAAGLPSVCGNSGGQPEAVLDGETGVVVNGEDLDSIVVALERLATQVDHREQMRAACRKWASQNDWANVLERTKELF